MNKYVFFLLTIIIFYASAINIFADDIDPHYKFSGVKAPASPYKNTWGAFQTDLFSGSFSYNYKIEAPPGINGLAPKLAIGYNSHSAKGKAGWVGAGWEIPQSYIQRNIQYTRSNPNDDTFELYLNGAKHDLVYVEADHTYHTRVESYLKTEWQVVGATNEKGGFWTVTTKDGTEYRFGSKMDSENVVQATDSSFDHYVWRWSLDRIKDTNGNCIYFTYAENPTSNDRGAVYLSKIEYNNDKKRTIEFNLETSDRPDVYLTIDQGSETREARRLGEILVKLDGSLVRKYKMGYSLNETQNRSLLTSITQYGADGTSALPPVTFQYKALDKGFNNAAPWATPDNRWIRKVDSDSDVVAETFDVNGDGLPDLVSYDNDHWDVWLHTGTGFAAQNQTWSIPSEWDIRDVQMSISGEQAPNTRSGPMDMNRDGLLDFVWADGSSTMQVMQNTGNGFAGAVPLGLPTTAWLREVRMPDDGKDPNTQQDMFDMNGDGLADIVKKVNSSTWHVWRNTGSGFADFGDWPVPQANAWLDDFSRGTNINTQVTHMDMNGDGLPDIIEAHDAGWHIWFNSGSNFIDGGIWQTNNFVNINDTTNSGNVGRDLLDINGDGLPDIVNPTNGGQNWEVYLNTGKGFTGVMSWLVPSGVPANGYIRNQNSDDGTQVERDVFDLDGDGLADLVRKDGNNNQWLLYSNKSGQSDLMLQVTDTLGGTVAINYGPSMAYANTRLPFNYWVVTSTATNNAVTGPHAVSATTNYSYSQGLYDFPSREFRGFGKVTETRADGSKVLHTYLQDEARKGKEASTEIRNNADAQFDTTVNSWESTVGNGVFTSNLAGTDQYIYDGVTSNPKVAKTQFQNYDAYGNVGIEINHGDLAVTGDETYSYKEYVYNPEAWIMDRPKHSYVSATAGGAKLRESWFYYDGSSILDNPPSMGNLTKEEHYSDSGANPVTAYGYDSYGNRTKITDAEGRVTRIEYDNTYHTFPEKSWNARNHPTIKVFNPANGEVKQETLPNGSITKYFYDTFQRKVKEVKPYDSELYPTTVIQYLLDGAAPKSVKISKRETAGGNGTLDTLQFIDGFGNLIQTKSEYTNSLNRTVVDLFYDEMGRVKKQSNPYLVSDSQNYGTPDTGKPAILYGYDTLGRPTLITNPDGTKVNRIFDHWSVAETDENGHAKSYLFDSGQRLKQVIENNSGASYTTNYHYSPLGELKQITDHLGNLTKIDYDSLGRKKKMVDPDLGTWSYGYDRLGNLVSQTDNRGVTTRIQYDELNRKTFVDYPNSQDIQFKYDLFTKGTLSQVIDGSGTVNYSYDQRLRKIQEDRKMDGFTWTTKWGYDSLDRVTDQTYPDGQKVLFNYNSQGKLDNIPGIVGKLDYNVAGQMTQKSFANGKSTSFTFDPVNQRLKGIGTSGIQNFAYTYDNVGNIKTITDGIAGKTESFGYDDLDRLTSAGDSGYSSAYQYNAIGNMLTSSLNNASTSYSYGPVGVRPHAVAAMTIPLPVVGSLELLEQESSKTYTTTGKVILDNVSYGNPTSYMASEDSAFTGAAWQPYSGKPAFTLSEGYGEKTVYFKVSNADGISSVRSSTIQYYLDSYGHGIPDTFFEKWEKEHWIDISKPGHAHLDPDHDGLTNLQEYLHGTNPNKADTDGDGLKDHAEISIYHSDPNAVSMLQPLISENYSIMNAGFAMGGAVRSDNTSIGLDTIGNQFKGVALTSSSNITIVPYTVSFVAGSGGSISGAPSQTIAEEKSTTAVTAVAASGYNFVNWTGTDGFVTTSANPLIINNVTTNMTVTANFSPGTVNGACGSSNHSAFIVTPSFNLCSAGEASVITGSGPWSWSCAGINGGTTASCQASLKTWSVMPTAGSNGGIAPVTEQRVNNGSSTSFTIISKDGYRVVTPIGGSCPQGTLNGTTYTTGAITDNCTIAPSFIRLPNSIKWQPQTQGLYGGHIQMIAIDPTNSQTVYVGTWGNGVFKSIDGGENWSQANTGLTNRSVVSLTIDTTNRQTIFAGTSGGLFKSSNGGESWSAINTGLSNSYVSVLTIDPANSQMLYAGTHSGVFKSVNGGVSWSAINTGLTNKNVKSLVIDPTNSQTVYAGTWSGVFKSSNGGATWSSINIGFADTFDFWVNSLMIDPASSQTLYAGTLSGLFKTDNGGATWSWIGTGMGPVEVKWMAIDSFNSQTLYVGTYDGIFKSSNGGSIWSAVNTELISSSVTFLAIDRSNSQNIYAGTNGWGVFKSNNGAGKWSAVNIGLAALMVNSVLIDSTDSQTVYAGTTIGVFKSDNDGASWNSINNGLANTYIQTLAFDPSDNQTIYAGTNGGVFKSNNAGWDWSAIKTGVPTYSLAISPTDSQTVYAGTLDALLMSNNGGASWRTVNTGLTSAVTYYDLAIDPTNNRTIYAGTSGGLFKSGDGGASWATIAGLPANSVLCLAIDPANSRTIYAEVNNSVFKSSNGGDSWSIFNTGLPGKTIESLAIDPSDNQSIYAGTNGGGIFYSSNGGANWSPINDGSISAIVKSLVIDPNNSLNIYAGAWGGLLKSSYNTSDYFLISASATANGAITPAIPQFVATGATVTYTITPDSDYQIITPIGGTCPQGVLSGTTYTTGAIAADCTVVPTFAPVLHSSCGSSNGGIFTIAPTTNLCLTGTASTVIGSGPWSWTCTETSNGETKNCSANLQTWNINATVTGGNGSVTCSTPVNNGTVATCVITPASGYQLATFTDNGADKKSSVAGGSYSINGVTADTVIVATFSPLLPLAVNGSCGTSNGGTFLVVPAINLCSIGSASTVTGTGPWSWSCAGLNGGVTATCTANIADATSPNLVISTLSNGSVTNNYTLNIAGTVTDTDGIKSLTINGQPVVIAVNGTFSQSVTLTAGANTITTVATDNADNKTTDIRTITLDNTAPTLTITAPADNSIIGQESITITGTVSETATVKARVGTGAWQTAQINGTAFSILLTLSSGQNTIEITATDSAGNSVATTAKRTIVSDTSKPTVAISDPNQDITITQGSYLLKGSAGDIITTVSVSVTFNGQTFTPAVTANGVFEQQLVFTAEKQYGVTVTATDQAGNSATAQRNIIYSKTTTGDLNGDGKVDIADALRALQIGIGIITPTAADFAGGDVAPLVNRKPAPDGKINIADAVVILQKVVGLADW